MSNITHILPFSRTMFDILKLPLNNAETVELIAKFTAFTWLDVKDAKRMNTHPRSRFWPPTLKNGKIPPNPDGL